MCLYVERGAMEKKKRQYRPSSPSDFVPAVSGEADAELGIELELALELIADPRQELAFRLRLKNWPYQEIADQVGVDFRTIHRWLNLKDGTVVKRLQKFFDE